MKTLHEIQQILREHKPELKERFKVKTMGVFGSCVRGEMDAGSDVDVLVEFYDPPGWEFIDLEGYLGNLVGTRVDLVMKSALKPRIGRHILQEVKYV